MRNRFIVAALALVTLAACQTDTQTPGQQAEPGQPRVVERIRSSGQDWGYPTPFAYIRGPGQALTLLQFDTLTWKDSTGQMMPWLASSWERSADGREWRFTLRDGVQWHDGQPLTAEDVRFTFDYLKNGAGSTSQANLGAVPIAGVTVEPPNVVVITLERPYAPFEENVAGRVSILPERVWSGVTEPARERGPHALTGTGPYRLEQFDQATGSYLFTANESYFLGPPVVKRLEFTPTGDDFAALQRGELHVAATGFAGGASGAEEGLPDATLRLFEGNRFGRVEAPGEFVRALHFNLTRGFPYDDRRFRQAIAYAIDREDAVRRILFGRGSPGTTGGLAPSNPYAITDLPQYRRDVARANALLDEIGLRDVNGDGRRDLPDGSPFTPELQTNSRYNNDTPVVVREYLRDVGIDVQIRSLDLATADQNAAQGQYDMALVAYGGLGGDPDGLRTRLSSTVRAQSFQRIHGWNNPQFEQAAAAQLSATDPDQRRQLVAQMQRAVAEDVPLIQIYHPARIAIFDRSVFDQWYFTPGGVFGGYPGILNKHVVVTGKKTGT
ncbi:MAG TPA: ABC transporter substrate-binding protein [Acidimicrobiales bacterium]|nr:ABC transporter substrate-binding protein [Acidimicrobiales bacterium]